MVTLFLVRHGETTYNISGHCQGDSYEIPLTDLGQEQAKEFAVKVSNIKFDKVFCSPLLRTKHTLNIIYDNYNQQLPSEITYLKDFREKSFGTFHHSSMKDYQGHLDKSGLPYHEFKFPDGENSVEFFNRTMRTLRELQTSAQRYKDQNWLCITHGGVISSLTAQLKKLSWDEFRTLKPLNLSISKVLLSPELQLLSFDEKIISETHVSLNGHL